MSKRGENIYKRKDGRWEGRYIKCRTPHGKIQYGYVYGKSYSEVKSKLKETTPMPIQTSNSQVPQPTSYNEILKMWLLELFRVSHIVNRKFGIGRSFRFLFPVLLSDHRSSLSAAARAKLH